MAIIPLIKGDTVDSNVEYRDALPVNYYAVPKRIFDVSGYMINWYGLEKFTEGRGVDRGGRWVSASNLIGHYRVSGSTVISIESSGNVTELGYVVNDGKQASIAYSFNNVAFVSGGNLYYYNNDSGLRQITGENVGNPIDIVWVDNYFFLTDGENIYHSDPEDEENYLPLDFDNAQFIPDPSRGLGVDESNEVIIFGQFSTEYFVNVGSTDFAFQRISQKSQKIGVLGTHCRRELNGNWYILGRREETSPSFHVVSVGSERVISTRETDKIASKYTNEELSQSTVDSLTIDNVNFVIFNLPNDTLVFNESISNALGIDFSWTILKSDVYGLETYRAKNPVMDPRTGKWIVGDKNNNTIGTMERDSCTQYEDIVEGEIFTPLLLIDSASIDTLEIQTIPGISEYEDATVAMSTTQNARLYSMEKFVDYGGNFQYTTRFYQRRLGYVRNYVGFKFRTASRSRMSFARMDIEYS